MERCGGRCEVIKKNGSRCWDSAKDVDHIEHGDDHSLANLRGICEWHHKRKSSREGNAAKALLLGALKRPPEPSPGVITGTPTPTKYKGF
jgi:5-methylcytosine-specific restriction protein A